MNTELNEAAVKYALQPHLITYGIVSSEAFIAGAQWKAEQKQVVSDEEIIFQLRGLLMKWFNEGKDSIGKMAIPIYPSSMIYRDADSFIKGFKSALQYSAGDGFKEEDIVNLLDWILENSYTTITGVWMLSGQKHFDSSGIFKEWLKSKNNTPPINK